MPFIFPVPCPSKLKDLALSPLCRHPRMHIPPVFPGTFPVLDGLFRTAVQAAHAQGALLFFPLRTSVHQTDCAHRTDGLTKAAANTGRIYGKMRGFSSISVKSLHGGTQRQTAKTRLFSSIPGSDSRQNFLHSPICLFQDLFYLLLSRRSKHGNKIIWHHQRIDSIHLDPVSRRNRF